jgi:hypothetical protein
MMVEDEFGGRRMNDLRTVVWLNMIDSMRAPLWFGVALAMMVLQTWYDAWQTEDGNYGGVQLMEVVQQVF